MKTNLSFFIILFVAVVTFVNDIIIYFLKLDYLVSLIISVLVVLGLLVFLFKKKKVELENYFCKWDLIFLGLYFVFTVIRIVTPDLTFDVLGYHYYNQKYPFIDKINFDFFVAGGSASDWIFPLGDRMNYIFRYFLGIRLGTILNYFSIIVLFYQIKKFLKYLIPDIKTINQILCAAFPISIPVIFRIVGTYYVDIYSSIFLLEIFYIGIKEKEIFNKKKLLYYWFLISGITIGIKISNLVLIIPIGINIIINNFKLFKKLRIRDYIISIAFFLLPFGIYGANNYIQVGNFFYPFLGGEKFFRDNNWKDVRFGISNPLLSLVWPIITTFIPTKGHDEDTLLEFIWAFGYIFLIINLITKVSNKELKDDLLKIEIITFISCILWALFMNGYCRYALIIPILLSISIVSNFCKNYNKSIVNKIFYGIQYIFLIVIFVVTLYGTKTEIKLNAMWFDRKIKNIFIDKNYTIHIDGVWGGTADNGGMVSLVREEGTPIYNLTNEYIEKSEFFCEKYKNILKDKDIYIITSKSYRDTENTLKKLGEKFEVLEKVSEYDYTQIPYIDYLDKWEIYKVRYKEKK